MEKITKLLMIISSLVALFTTFAILMSVTFESIKFFSNYKIFDFLFNVNWSPQSSFSNTDQVGSFGIVPLFLGTLLITLIAMFVAVPIGILSAIYISEFSSSNFRKYSKPILEILAGIPTVVYGFIAIIYISPLVAKFGKFLGLETSSESALGAGLVMGIMVVPFITSLTDDAIHSVPDSIRDASLGLGATRAETMLKVIFPAAMPGIVAAIILGFSRAIGETMIVVMAAGLSANLTFNPLQSVTTITVQIVTALTGDTEFDSPATMVAFALGLFLFIITFILNIWALRLTRKYTEVY